MARSAKATMTAAASLLAAATAAQADYTSRLQVGNWSGGAWADAVTKEFRNCGAALKLSSGTELTVVVGSNFAPAFIVADPRIQVTPRQTSQVPVKFDDGASNAPMLALSATMVQIVPPAFPGQYDLVRKAKRFAFIVPGLNTSLDVTGLDLLLPKLHECVVVERGRMQLGPAPLNETTATDRSEVFAATLVAAESCRGAYEEVYILPRRNGGQIEISLSGPPQRRKTLEAIGAKYRAAFATLP